MMGLYVKSPNHVNWQSNVMEFVDRVRSRDFQYILLCVSSEEMKYCKVSGNNTLMKWKCLRVMYLLFLISSVL